MYSLWSQRMSGITLKRSASVLRIVSLPFSVRPTGSGPRASQKVASSVKCDTMRSTSRLLKAAEIDFISSGVARSGSAVATSGIRNLPASGHRTIAGLSKNGKTRPSAAASLRHIRRRRASVHPTRKRQGDLPVFDYIIVGGGSAGSVMAHRLSAKSATKVLLCEAGQDTPPGKEPPEIAGSYSGTA